MALTRKMLKAMGIDEEKIEQIIEAHSETVSAIKDERDELKDKFNDYETIKAERDDLKKSIEDSAKDSWKVKYEAIKEDFDNYKKDITAKETKSAKETVLRNMLKEIGISEKRIDSVMKVSDVSALELDKDGKLKDADKHKEAYKTEWADFIVTSAVKGANTPTPPANNGGKGTKTKAEILAIKDTVERQKAIAENPTVFGIN